MEQYLSNLKGDMNEILRLSDKIKKIKHYLTGMNCSIQNFHLVSRMLKNHPLMNKKWNS